jgi:hypothetical protein
MQLSPDQLDDVLTTADVSVTNNQDDAELDPRLNLLYELNRELAKDGGQAGTHAYDMMAAVEEINAGNASVLIELIAAVVMSKSAFLGDTTASVTFSPSDIDEMQRHYEVGATRDGMQLTVTLTPKDTPGPSWRTDAQESGEGAYPQAEAPDTPERPVWAVRDGTTLVGCEDRPAAEAWARKGPETATVENRFCLHSECPSTHCNQAEATSEA